MKHIRYMFFCLLLILIISKNVSAADVINSISFDDNEVIDSLNGVLNPKWEYYNSLSDEEKANWEVVPEKYIIPNNSNESPNYYAKKRAYAPIVYSANPPATFDLRSYNGQNYVTPIGNQGGLGVCWAFASNASVESNMLMKGQGTHDFSERHLDYAAAENSYAYSEGYNPYEGSRNLGQGGTFNSAARFYAMGLAPVEMIGTWTYWNEYTSPVSIRDVFNLDNNKYLVTNYVKFPTINNRTASDSEKTEWRNKVKNQVMNNGAVYISTLSPQSTSKGCYVNTSQNGITGLINWNESCESQSGFAQYNGTHAMAIIGWDDNYTLNYCSYKNGSTSINTGEGACNLGGGKYNTVKGAWILKNSWGTLSPYVYLAYDSDYLEAAGISKVVDKDYDNTYNSYGPIFAKNLSGRKAEYSFYKPRPTETLKRITFETSTTQKVTYTIYYGDNTSKILIGTVEADMPGRYSIDVNDAELNQEDFKIYIEPSTNSAYAQASKIYAFTNSEYKSPSATTYVDVDEPKWQSNGSYLYTVKTRAINLPTGTQLSFIVRDVNGNIIVNYTDNKSYLVAGAYEGVISLGGKLPENSIYYIDTYANNQLIGKNSFATGIGLASRTVSNKLYYQLKNESDLKYLTTLQYKFSNFELANDITLTSDNFEPLGRNTVDQFRGTLEGNNHTIYNLQEDNSNTGLFFKIEATVSNLKIKGAKLNSTGNSSGVLASQAYGSTIKNVLVEGMLISTDPTGYIGGVVGYAEDTDFINIVNETSLASGRAGAITGYLGKESTITDALNQGLISNNNSAISTFFHSSALSKNTVEGLIDLAIESNPSCGTPYNSEADKLTYNHIAYLEDNNCNYIGDRIKKENIKSEGSYGGFDSGWVIEADKLPYLKDNPVTYITEFTPIGAENLFIGINSIMEISTTPDDATYKGVTLKSNNEGIVKVINGNQLQGVTAGEATVTVTTGDGTYISQDAKVYVLDDTLKARYNNGYLYIPENSTTESLAWDKYTISASSEQITTGTKLTYKIDDQVVGNFIGIIKGDLNKDGKIQANDILLMKRHILQLDIATPLDIEQLYAGNITGEGITSLGVLKMQRHILNLDGGGELG